MLHFSLGLAVIGSVGIDGSGYKEIKTEGSLMAFTLINKVLVWITKKGTFVWESFVRFLWEKPDHTSLRCFFFFT